MIPEKDQEYQFYIPKFSEDSKEEKKIKEDEISEYSIQEGTGTYDSARTSNGLKVPGTNSKSS